jgi:hypothetical protein
VVRLHQLLEVQAAPHRRLALGSSSHEGRFARERPADFSECAESRDFFNSLLETNNDPQLVTFTILFPEDPLSREEADLFAIEVGKWIVDATDLHDGDVLLLPVEADIGTIGFDVLVISPDPKSASLLRAYFASGTIGFLGESAGQRIRVSDPVVRRLISC